MAFNREAAEAVLKTVYLPTIRPQINQSTAFKAVLERNSENLSGLEAHLPLHVGRSEAVGARGEDDDLPTATSQRYAASKFYVRANTGSIEVTQALIESAKTDKGAYLRATESEMKGLTQEFAEDQGRQFTSNDDDGVNGPVNLALSVGGASGKLAGCGTTSSSTTVQLTGTDASTWRKLRKNMVVDIVNSSTHAVLASARTVTAVDKANETIDISGAAVTTTTAHVVTRAGAYGKEMRGILSIAKDDTELQGVDPTDEDEWKASVIDASDAPYSEMLVQELLDEIDAASGVRPSHLLCEYTQERAIYADLKSMKRAVNTLELKGGFSALTINDNIPILVDRFFPADKIAAFNTKHLSIYETGDVHWGDEDGHILKWVSGKMKWQAFLVHFADLATDRRNTTGVINNLATS